MKSKEEIFNAHSWAELGAISPSKSFCLKAMDEYAKEVAIDFSEWIRNERYYWEYTKKVYLAAWNDYSEHTPEQLFEIYLQSKQKQ